MILATDIFCDYFDRFPTVWDNNGNQGNILLKINSNGEMNNFYAIDTRPFPIDLENE